MSDSSTELLGSNPAFLRLMHAMRMAAATDASVMINGERGSGKTSLGHQIHACSRRRNNSYVPVNCAGISDAAFAAVLGGAAVSEKSGSPVISPGATLFFDDVSELSWQSQSMLFHFLDAAGCDPGFRVLSSSSRDLMELVRSNRFREDLFYRLYVVPLDLPPLRERTEDLVVLLKHFTREITAAHRRPAPHYSVSTRNLLKEYAWPGNLRELHNLCERMVILMAGKTVQPEHLPLEIRHGKTGRKKEILFALPAEGVDLLEMEGEMIRQALGMAGGNRSKAARLLRLTRDTLLYRIQKHKIEV